MPPSLSQFRVWNAKIDQIAEDLKAQGICEAEAKAMQRAGRDVEQAQRALDRAVEDRNNSGISAVASGVVLVSCPNFETGVGALACIGGGATLGLLAFRTWVLGDDSVDLATDELEDALDDLDSALDEVCRCRMKHGPGNP